MQTKRVSSDSPTITALKYCVVITKQYFYAVMGTPKSLTYTVAIHFNSMAIGVGNELISTVVLHG